jgi:hypothetical protein
MPRYKQLFAAAAAWACVGQGHAQETPAELAAPALPELASADSVHRRTLAVIGGELLLLGWYGKTNWWQEGNTGEFRTVKEGWFGQNTYAGGADKLGHFYMNYVGSRVVAHALRWAGNDDAGAVTLGTLTTLGAMTVVEIIDGYSKRWRFSREDAVMNVLGAGAAVLMERNPAVDRLLDFRLHYKPSASNQYNFDPFGDYSGQTYIVALKASGIPGLREHRWLRYVELVAGYGARDFPENRPNISGDHRTRNVYAGISLNLSEVLGSTVFKNSPDSRARKFTNAVLEFVQPPGTAVYRHRTLSTD